MTLSIDNCSARDTATVPNAFAHDGFLSHWRFRVIAIVILFIIFKLIVCHALVELA